MKKYSALLLTAILSIAAAQESTPTTETPVGVAAPTSTPDPQLKDAPVTVETGNYTGPLSSLLAAIAKTAGYGLVLDTNIDAPSGTANQGSAARPVVYSFQNKPFNQVWPLLMDVYGLSYQVIEIGGQPLLRVGNTPIQRIVSLKNADATQAANQVKMFFGTPVYSEQSVKNTAGDVTGTTSVLTDIKLDSATLRVIPDTRSNSVVVRGTNREVLQVEQLLTELDKVEAPAPAETQAPAPKEEEKPAPLPTVQKVYDTKSNPDDLTKLLLAQYPDFKVTPVGKTNQLVITGRQDLVEQALELLSRVDKPAPEVVKEEAKVEEIVQRVFTLVNASAENVKATLEGTLQRELQTPPVKVAAPANTTILAPTPTATSAVNTAAPAPVEEPATASPKATIIADTRTNVLIVRGTPKQVAQIAELIPQLDVAVPQVNLQVRIQEITEEATRSLGMDWKVTYGGFNVNVTGSSGTLRGIFNPMASFMPFNIIPTLDMLSSQGLTRTIYDSNVTMQSGQRALGNNTSTENSSSGAAATIKSGGRLELNLPGGAGESIQKQIDYGLNLDFFQPQVAPDGTITVRVRGQVSNLKTAIGQTVPNILDFSNSEAQSTISFKNGQTVLLGGLLGTSSSQNNAGVPFLSDIPVIGGLFGKQTSKTKETQLLIVITGTVVK